MCEPGKDRLSCVCWAPERDSGEGTLVPDLFRLIDLLWLRYLSCEPDENTKGGRTMINAKRSFED